MTNGCFRMAFPLIFLSLVLLYPFDLATAQVPEYGDYINFPGAGLPADPTVIEKDGTWYLYPTTIGDRLECWSSSDFDVWTYEGVIWGPAPQGSWNDHGVWAPDVFEHEESFYIYYTAAEMIGVAVADNPLGPFVDVYDHPLIGDGWGNVTGHAIDAHMFRDTDGSLYLYATGYYPITFLRVFPMTDPVNLQGTWDFLFSANPFSWELFVIEGPWMILHDGRYYLMYSGNGANQPLYSIGYATADNPMGPFTKYERNPILRMDPEYDFWGPGHHTLTIGPDGETWMFYHTKIDSQINYQRRIRKNKVVFTEDGQLYVDLGLGPPPPLDDDDDDDNDDDSATDDDDDTTHDDDDVPDDDDDGENEAASWDMGNDDDAGCGC